MQSPSNSQLKAIKHGEGTMLVLAGPGSGKTFVMIQRLLYLINEKQIRQDSILVISFSKASALELKQRFQKQYKNVDISHGNNYGEPQVNFFTFHACFFHILKEAYHYTSKDIITEKQKRELMKIVLSDPAIGEKAWFKEERQEENKTTIIYEKIEEHLQKISYYKNKGIKEMEEKETGQFQKIYRTYNEEMHHGHRLDFDDMGLLCLQLFKNNPDILKKWQEQFQYVLIDEFQDINEIQFRIVQLLVKKQKNLFVVGDDDQSIYSFRGANPKIMLEFKKYYPDTKQVLLETNYRCSEAIVKESLKVIEKNKLRFKKEIKAFEEKNANLKKNHKVCYQGFEDCHKEYAHIAEWIEEAVSAGDCDYTDIACIFRTNQNMTGLAEHFLRKKIPFVMKEGCSSIFKNFVALDMLSYLQFFLDGKKRGDFLRIMNKPVRYFSRNCLTDTQIDWRRLKQYYSTKSYMVKNIEALEQNEKWIQKLDLYGACFYIRQVIGYERYLKEFCKQQGLSFEEHLEILDFIHGSMKGMNNLTEWKEYIHQYEEALKDTKNEEKKGVQILTFHACKGLEYRAVFLPDCNEGKVPHKKAALPEEIEEERRMFYVAMTRAKEHLEILYIEDKLKKHLPPSRFLPFKNETKECGYQKKLHIF